MLDLINKKTKGVIQIWKNYSDTVAPDVYTELSKTSFEMIEIMTDKLEIWDGKSLDIGDKVLLYSCIGCIVEAWLRFFYCIYHNDYDKEPFEIQKKDGTKLKKSRDDIKFQQIIEYSVNKIFQDKNDDLYKWVEKIRKLRNSIHIFNVSDFTNCDYNSDIKELNDFIDRLCNQLPPIEDVVDEKYGDWDYR